MKWFPIGVSLSLKEEEEDKQADIISEKIHSLKSKMKSISKKLLRINLKSEQDEGNDAEDEDAVDADVEQ